MAKEPGARPRAHGAESLNERFAVAVGEHCPSAHPETFEPEPAAVAVATASGASWFDGSRPVRYDYAKKVKIQKKVVAKGGCG